MEKLIGNVILPDKILSHGAVGIEDGIIKFIGNAEDFEADDVTDFGDNFIAPGFVDIHCHASTKYFSHENPEQVSDYHLSHGTTSMLMTIYRNVPHNEMLSGIEKIKSAMKTHGNIFGVHLEGPYLNPMYGTGKGCKGEEPDYKDYSELADTGIIKQWTFAPEVKGTDEFCRYIKSHGIVPSVGHSKASADDIRRAAENGAEIVTHLFDATGCAYEKSSVEGTKEVDFDHAVLAEDNFYYEIICDKNCVHVRKENLKLAVKCAGKDRIVAITDSYYAPGDNTDSDILFIDGLLSGSKLTMDRVAQNLYGLGYSLPDIFKFCSLNPAKAIKIDGNSGSLEVGKKADIVVFNDNLKILKIFHKNT